MILFSMAALLVLASPLLFAQSTVVDCSQLFQGTGNPYLTTPGEPSLASITGGGAGGVQTSNVGTNPLISIVSISLLIILVVLTITGLVYAVGYAFQIETLLTFAKTEIAEAFINLLIIAAVAGGISLAVAGVYFFANFAALNGAAAITSSTSAYDLYTSICNNVQNSIVVAGLTNWFGVFMNLYITNFFASGSPPQGGLALHFMPNGFGFAFSPFQGLALVTTLLWDMQTIYFGTMFLGMFIIMLLFLIYFLFPLIFYVGIALRSFPWTRPAGGSLIALFIAFYIVFPALIYPFSMPAHTGSDPDAGKGFCALADAHASDFSAGMLQLCTSHSFLIASSQDYTSLIDFNFGDIYYDTVYSFITGIEFSGLNLVGLIIALLISYELVEKIGGLLGSPSLQGSRALSRIL